MGLGVLGGGVATTKWFLRRGARVTVTDLRPRRALESSLKALGNDARRVRFVLGRHHLKDFKMHDLLVANPAVPQESPYLAAARKAGKLVVNDARIFFDSYEGPLVAVTGTRGKTTTVAWIAHLMRGRHPALLAGGNSSSDMPLLKLLSHARSAVPSVVELSSWQLERVAGARRGPDVAVVTNLYPDHLNRHRTMREYARAKANIFIEQHSHQSLILNADNPWTRFFLSRKPKSSVYFVSSRELPKDYRGVFLKSGTAYVRMERGVATQLLSRGAVERFSEAWGGHNLMNALTAVLAARLMGVPFALSRRRLASLPKVPYREEIVRATKRLLVVNDSAGTSPDATVAALRRFTPQRRVLLLAGGTDKELEFGDWAQAVARAVPPEDLLLLQGSATAKMLASLRRIGYFKKAEPRIFENLQAMVRAARDLSQEAREPAVILFSPGAASFERFKNEFDRGKKFNTYSSRYLT
jgi:UDP-N-acetylmuramoylalanine--D-glutamate ligase